METVFYSWMSGRLLRSSAAFLLLLSLILLSACGVPPQMQIRRGVDPQYQDDDVRFRATYYFRVFRRCESTEGDNQRLEPMVDSLYRFRMTGKAPSLTTKVQFESGTLLAEELDPYGVPVRPARDVQEGKGNNARGKDSKASQDKVGPKDKTATPATAAAKQDGDGQPGSAENVNDSGDKGCPKGYQARKGFQIWGPEGWREFNQNERLIMAMSTTAEPLIGSLQRVARMQRMASGDGAAIYLLVGEQTGRTEEAVEAVEACKADQPVTACLQDVLRRYKGE